MEPIAQHGTPFQRGGLAHEHKKSGLKSIFGIGGVAEHAATDAEH